MGGGSAFWIRDAGADDTELATTLGGWRDRVPEPHSTFLRVENDADPPLELMTQLSKTRGTDVLWVAVQRSVDAFEFLHFREGELVRALVFGCYRDERTWERIAGVPEPWEAWKVPPVLGKFDPLDATDVAWMVFEHYGLQDVAPRKPAKQKKSASATPKKPKPKKLAAKSKKPTKLAKPKKLAARPAAKRR